MSNLDCHQTCFISIFVRLFFSRILCCFEFHFIRINETNFSFYSKPFPFSSHFCSFLWDDYTVEVHINDYLDIICPHYTHGEVPSHQAERYVLYMVEKEDYDVCKPHSFDQLRWECSRPFAPHVPEKFSEKFQRFTPFTLGKEFRQGESYYYISKPMHHHGADCLKLRVDVVGRKGFSKTSLEKSKADKTDKSLDEENIKFSAVGGVHNPSNRLPAGEGSFSSAASNPNSAGCVNHSRAITFLFCADPLCFFPSSDDPAAMEPKVQRSIGSSAAQLVSLSLFFTMIPVLFAPVLH
uniref:Ephrin-A1 n=1 Tax=Oryzias sinensis TaxID=183150 RepID=A0A8C8DRF0_9TELE